MKDKWQEITDATNAAVESLRQMDTPERKAAFKAMPAADDVAGKYLFNPEEAIMGDKLQENSEFVVCRACSRYFHMGEIFDHQRAEHLDHKWDMNDSPLHFYYLTNREVSWTLNRGRDLRNGIAAIRDLMVF